jgi:hypothetical protein
MSSSGKVKNGVKCKKNEILIRSYKKKSGVRVKPHCTPDKGAKGRTPLKKRVLPELKKDEFVKYGYSTKLSASKRLSKLKRAIKDLSYASVLKRIVVLRTYNKRNPKLYAKFDCDIKALQKWRKAKKAKKAKKAVKKSVKKSVKKISKVKKVKKAKKSKKVARYTILNK